MASLFLFTGAPLVFKLSELHSKRVHPAKRANLHYNRAMIGPFVSITRFKILPSKWVAPYKDPFRKLHAQNQEAIKKREALERRFLKQDEQKRMVQHKIEERSNKEYALARYKLLYVI